MHYQIVSFNYKNCDFLQREALAFKSDEEIKSFLKQLIGFHFINEAFIINTCNRVEIVSSAKDNFATYHAILGLLSKNKGVNFYELEKIALRKEDEEAIEHFFKVISSLDSLVVGEAQITGQVKQAFRLSYENMTAGRELNRLVSYGVKCAAEVRNSTNISQNPVSIASVAVAKAKEDMGGSLSGLTGIVIGTGEMGQLAAKHLLREGADVILISRDINRAKELAAELGENVKVGDYEKLPKYINRYRLLFSATASKKPIITEGMIENENLNRVWFDMAIPRDIDDIKKPNIKVYRIDDLEEISKNNFALRQEQALIAEEIVKKYKEDFLKWLQALAIEPVIKQMRLDILDVVDYEVNRVIKKGFFPKEYEENLRHMAIQLFDKYLHNPTKNLRAISKGSNAQEVIDAIKSVFNIETNDIDPSIYKKGNR